MIAMAGRVADALRAARDVVRHRGVLSTLCHAWRLYAWGEDRVVIVEYVFTGGQSPERGVERRPDGITFGPATPRDLAELPLLDPHGARRILSIIERGDCWLHVARDGDRLVGYRFATRRYCGYGVPATVIRPAADQVFIDNVFVHPDYRGRDIAGCLVVAQNPDLMASGIRGALGAVSVGNVASLRHRRTGARPTLFLESRRRLFYRRCTVSPTLPSDIQRMLDGKVGS